MRTARGVLFPAVALEQPHWFAGFHPNTTDRHKASISLPSSQFILAGDLSEITGNLVRNLFTHHVADGTTTTGGTGMGFCGVVATAAARAALFASSVSVS